MRGIRVWNKTFINLENPYLQIKIISLYCNTTID
jgi:hypothetical protein